MKIILLILLISSIVFKKKTESLYYPILLFVFLGCSVGFFIESIISWINDNELDKEINRKFIPLIKKLKEKEKENKEIDPKKFNDLILNLKSSACYKKRLFKECILQNFYEGTEIINTKDFINEMNEIILK